MTHQALNVVRNFLKEHFPIVRMRDGVMNDLFCKAFDLLFDDTITDMNSYLEDMDIRQYASMSEADLDRAAAHWFITRNQGSKGSTVMTVALNRATKINLNQGTVFGTSSGLHFISTRTVSFSASQVSSSQSGNYFIIKVPVQAEEEGTEYNVSAGEINSIVSPAHFDLAYVTNESAVTSGANKETNTELYMRLVQSVNTRNLLITRNSIATVVLDNFPTLKDVTVAGKGDDEMQRDRIYDVVMPGGFSPYNRSDFWGKRKGIVQYNPNIAREGRLTSATPGAVADVEDAIAEIDQEGYYDIAGLDLEFLSTRGGLEFLDTFGEEGIPISGFVSRTQGASNWICTDSGLEFGQTVYGNSISVYNGWLCLGATSLTASAEEI